ncbi:uncharacterized protein LOC133796272 [Humulus lupulus]|uniref:uncharacterized protein LOC133796272 n=1 Tax=Humulus lupulus TaxID=3486 RepID=UPI002B40ACE3|nr:uncharacterized protein LOC133796272 [Humulus lupulus]
MAANSQQFGARHEVSVKGVNETNSKVEQQLAQLTSMVQQMALENTTGHIATSLSQSAPQNQGKLRSQPVRNPRENANAITLRDGKTYGPPSMSSSSNDATLPPTYSAQQDKDETLTTTPKPKPNFPTYVTTPLFPSHLRMTKNDEAEQEILETFRKVEGASINVILSSMCTSLNLGPLEEMGVISQLAGHSNAYRRGVVENVFVEVNDSIPCSTSILLGRPFLKIARTKIDIHEGTLTMEFDGEVVHINIFQVMRYPSDVDSVSSIDILDSLSQRIFYLHGEDGLEVVLREPIDLKKEDVTTEVKEMVDALNNGVEVSKEV